MGKLSLLKSLFDKTIKFGPLIALGNVVQTHGRHFLPSGMIDSLVNRRNAAIDSRLSVMVDEVVESYSSYQSPKACAPDDAVIWVCWLQGELNMPAIPKICLDSVRRHAGNHKVCVLTLDNYRDYVDLDPNIVQKYEKGIIKHCHFADILRISVLAQRGGLWIDATMYCSRDIPDDVFNMPFFSIKSEPKGHFVSECRWAVFCLGTHKGSKLFVMLEQLFKHYLQKENLFVDYFLFDHFINLLYKHCDDVRKEIDDLPMNNPDCGRLTALLPEKFEESVWESLTDNTFLFKLSWKQYSNERLEHFSNSDTYFAHIKYRK